MSFRTFSEADALPDKIVMYAQQGFGKTTFGAFAPKPIFLMSPQETGYLTLRRNNLVPDCPFDIVPTWEAFEVALREIIVKGVGDRETLVLDCIGGFERLCHEHVCREKYNNDWGAKGFLNYMVGYRTGGAEFAKMLPILDEIVAKRKMRIIALSHTRIDTFDNPLGAKFNVYSPDCHERTWEPIAGWCDALLFGRFKTITAEIKGDVKGVGGVERVVGTEQCDAYKAKNRHGLPREINMPKKPSEMWSAIGDRLAAAAKGNTTPPAPAAAPAADDDTKRKQWAQEQADKTAHDKRAAAKAAEEKAIEGAKADAHTIELEALIAEYDMKGMVPKWEKHFKVKSLADLTADQKEALISKIKSTKKELAGAK